MIEGLKIGFARHPLKFYQAMGNARCIVIELDPYQSCLGKGLGSTSKFDSFALVPLSNDKVLSRRKKGKRIT